LLSCRIPGDESARVVSCCRLALLHRPGPGRVRRYPSDTTDAQWPLIDPLLPDPAWLGAHGGRPEQRCRRAIVDAIFYLVDNGIKWRVLPADFPPWSTVYNFFAAWAAAGVTVDLLDTLRERVRLTEGRTASPTGAVIDSQSVRAAEVAFQPRLGRRQEGQRPQTAHRRGHPRPAAVRGRDRGQHPRPRRRPAAADHPRRHLQPHRLVWADAGYAGALVAPPGARGSRAADPPTAPGTPGAPGRPGGRRRWPPGRWRSRSGGRSSGRRTRLRCRPGPLGRCRPSTRSRDRP
jgi:transposase